MEDDKAAKLARIDVNMATVMNYDLKKYSDTFNLEPDAYIVGGSRLDRVYYTNKNQKEDIEMFEFKNSNNFIISYSIGDVGMNNEAKIISKVYYANGTEMK